MACEHGTTISDVQEKKNKCFSQLQSDVIKVLARFRAKLLKTSFRGTGLFDADLTGNVVFKDDWLHEFSPIGPLDCSRTLRLKLLRDKLT